MNLPHCWWDELSLISRRNGFRSLYLKSYMGQQRHRQQPGIQADTVSGCLPGRNKKRTSASPGNNLTIVAVEQYAMATIGETVQILKSHGQWVCPRSWTWRQHRGSFGGNNLNHVCWGLGMRLGGRSTGLLVYWSTFDDRHQLISDAAWMFPRFPTAPLLLQYSVLSILPSILSVP